MAFFVAYYDNPCRHWTTSPFTWEVAGSIILGKDPVPAWAPSEVVRLALAVRSSTAQPRPGAHGATGQPPVDHPSDGSRRRRSGRCHFKAAFLLKGSCTPFPQVLQLCVTGGCTLLQCTAGPSSFVEHARSSWFLRVLATRWQDWLALMQRFANHRSAFA